MAKILLYFENTLDPSSLVETFIDPISYVISLESKSLLRMKFQLSIKIKNKFQTQLFLDRRTIGPLQPYIYILIHNILLIPNLFLQIFEIQFHEEK